MWDGDGTCQQNMPKKELYGSRFRLFSDRRTKKPQKKTLYSVGACGNDHIFGESSSWKVVSVDCNGEQGTKETIPEPPLLDDEELECSHYNGHLMDVCSSSNPYKGKFWTFTCENGEPFR